MKGKGVTTSRTQSQTISPTFAKLLDFLDTPEACHSGRTLRDHLLGTHDLLRAWGNSEHVCLAGLFHSIYGTQEYAMKSVSVEHRDTVRQLIGNEAEDLAFMFCTVDRNGLFQRTDGSTVRLKVIEGNLEIDVSRETLRCLIEIEVANIVEQMLHTKHAARDLVEYYSKFFEQMQEYISSAGLQQFRERLGQLEVA